MESCEEDVKEICKIYVFGIKRFSPSYLNGENLLFEPQDVD